MTVKELLKILNSVPKDLEIRTRHSPTGYVSVSSVRRITEEAFNLDETVRDNDGTPIKIKEDYIEIS